MHTCIHMPDLAHYCLFYYFLIYSSLHISVCHALDVDPLHSTKASAYSILVFDQSAIFSILSYLFRSTLLKIALLCELSFRLKLFCQDPSVDFMAETHDNIEAGFICLSRDLIEFEFVLLISSGKYDRLTGALKPLRLMDGLRLLEVV